jgi:Flp pilus assembly protein TadD
LGIAYSKEGKFADAERAFWQALEILGRKTKPDAETLAIVYANMANLYDI